MFRLDGKVALVTGVGGGIGQALTLVLADAGADIAGVYRSQYEETKNRVERSGRRFVPVKADLQKIDMNNSSEIISRIIDELDGLDILVNCAGIIHHSKAENLEKRHWDEILQVDLTAIFFLSQAAATVMIPRGGGKIINITSLLSYQGGICVSAYTVAKSAVAGVTRALANEWAS